MRFVGLKDYTDTTKNYFYVGASQSLLKIKVVT